MKAETKIFLFLFLVTTLSINVGFCFSEAQNDTRENYKKEKEEIDGFAQDIGITVSSAIATELNKVLNEAIEKAKNMVAFTIPDESEYIIIETTREAAQNQPYNKRKRILIKNMNSVLKDFFNEDKICNTVVLNIGAGVTYQHIYKIIAEFEEILRNNKEDKVKNVEILYVFAKPL